MSTATLPALRRGRFELAIDFGIRTRRDLAAILPQGVAFRAEPELLGDRHAAGALRILAAVPERGWRITVKRHAIDVDGLMEWAETVDSATTRSLVSAAVTLYGSPRHPQLSWHTLTEPTGLEDEQVLIVLDGLRIAREGLER